MGRWDDKERRTYDNYRRAERKGLIGARGVRRIIFIGFGILAIIMVSFFASRAGLHVALYERSEAIGTVQVITAQISNNSLDTLQNVTVQFGQNNPKQVIGNMGPFSSSLVSPEGDDYNFDKVIVTANNGSVNVVKNR